MAAFFQERYGIEDPKLAAALRATTPIIPPSTRAAPKLDDKWAGWVMTGQDQADQLKEAFGDGSEKAMARCKAWREQMAGTLEMWRRAAGHATRNREELRAWDLAFELLVHRLKLLDPLMHLAAVAYAGAPASDDQVAGWTRAVHAFDEPRQRLREGWAEFFHDIHTEHHLKIELYNWFDAEREMVDQVVRDVVKKRTGTTSRP